MASPQESITTVNGRRCTRSRARAAAPSSITEEPAIVTPTEVTTTTAADEAAPAPAQSSAAEPPPPPAAAPPASSAAAEQPVTAPTPTQATVSSATGTISAAPLPPAPPAAEPPRPQLVPIAPPAPAAAAPKGPVEASRLAAAPSPVAVVTTAAPAAPAPARSDTPALAVLPPLSRSTRQAPAFTAPGAVDSAVGQPSLPADPAQPSKTDTPPQATTRDAPVVAQPEPTTAPPPALPSGDSTNGVIGPEFGDADGEGGLTIPNDGEAIGSIVGGVIGGVAGLALVCALLFFCLRKRKTRQPRWVEKRAEGPRFVQKVKAIPAGVSVIFAKVKELKPGSARNPYQRHSQQDSISSVYSAASHGRPRSASDALGLAAAEPPLRRSSSRKSERNRLRKKNSSVSSQSTFAGAIEELEREATTDPFADPEPPRILRLSNPDTAQSARGPVTPQPAVTPARTSTNPFVSPFDDPVAPPGWPEALPPTLGHKRTQSSASALSSHPPTFMFPGPSDATRGAPSTSQPPLSNQKRRSSMAYPTFDATSTGASRISDLTLFGEPGPSRPGTGLFAPGIRTVRQSDPFDLDRPEVLGFGDVVGRKEVRASVTRQATRGKRTSSVGNWSSVNDGPYPSFNNRR